MQLDGFSFLNPWTLMLPEAGGAVLMAVGSGGKSTLLRRLHDHYRSQNRSVAWWGQPSHPPPFGIPEGDARDPEAARALLSREGSVFLSGRSAAAVEVESLRHRLQPDLFLVEGGPRAGGRFEPQPSEADWPTVVHQLFCVAPLHAVGRPWSAKHVSGAPEEPERADGELRRVRSAELLTSLQTLSTQWPAAIPLVVPFLTGFGSYRDVDGMFSLVSELCALPGAKAVCLGELLGDERRDAADRSGLPEGSAALRFLEGERVYAVYPAELDD